MREPEKLRAKMTARFLAHNAEVIRTVPKEKLLVFRVQVRCAPPIDYRLVDRVAIQHSLTAECAACHGAGAAISEASFVVLLRGRTSLVVHNVALKRRATEQPEND